MKYFTLISILVIIIIILFAIVYISQYISNKNKIYEPHDNKLTFLNLVLYSKDEEYEKMYKLTRKYYKTFNNVKTIYYKYNENMNSDFLLKDDILDIRGKETYIPGILEKTLKAFNIISANDFDYLIRINISTIVNFDLLTEYLTDNPIGYGGGIKNAIHQLDESSGIIDETYFGTEYASGTSIILSKNTFNDILRVKDNIKKNFIDDVAIGILVKEYLSINPKYVPNSRFIFIPNENGDAKKIIELINDKNYIFYRNRQPNRKIDVIQMKIIIDYLQRK